MSKKDKLIRRFQQQPSDFHYDEMVKLLGFFGYYPAKTGKISGSRTGKISGSRVRFEHKDGSVIMLHKPHPEGIMKKYQLKQVKMHLQL